MITFPVAVEIFIADQEERAGCKFKVEAALDGLCWEKSEEYIDAEKIYQLTYEIEV